MTDRELLERASRAAGLPVDFSSEIPMLLKTDGAKFPDAERWEVDRLWNPLTDDGDALRLAVTLRLQIDLMAHAVAVGYGKCKEDSLQRRNEAGEGYEDGEDPCAATRRAIVSAAAAMSPLPSEGKLRKEMEE